VPFGHAETAVRGIRIQEIGMRYVYRYLTLGAVVVLATGTLRAGILFSDDFSTGTEPDPAKWTQTEDTNCSVYLSGGALYAQYIGQNSSRHARVDSCDIDLPSGWTEIVLTGQWAFPTQGYGECFIRLHDPDDTSVFVQASYVNWVGASAQKAWRGSYTGSTPDTVTRPSLPTALTDFTMTVMPTGWSFVTEGGSINKAYTTAHMAGLDKAQIRIGGWEYSAYWNEAVFDDIQLTPEPATLALLALGGFGLLARRRRK